MAIEAEPPIKGVNEPKGIGEPIRVLDLKQDGAVLSTEEIKGQEELVIRFFPIDSNLPMNTPFDALNNTDTEHMEINPAEPTTTDAPTANTIIFISKGKHKALDDSIKTPTKDFLREINGYIEQKNKPRAGNTMEHRALLESLFVQYREPLINFGKRQGHSHETAEDIYQETFLKLWEILPTLDLTKSLNAYIYTLARNASTDLHRRGKRILFINESMMSRKIRSEDEELPEDYFYGLVDPENPYEDLDYLEFINDIIALMPHADEQEALRYIIAGLNYKEISEHVGVGENATATRITRAKKSFVKIAKEEGGLSYDNRLRTQRKKKDISSVVRDSELDT